MGKLIIAEVPVKKGRYNEEGDYAISGVPGSSGKITLRFTEPGGQQYTPHREHFRPHAVTDRLSTHINKIVARFYGTRRCRSR